MTTTKSNLPALRFQDEQGINYPDWKERRLSDVLDYEQPTEFLVRNRDYDDSYKTPVLTAGKTFLLGYTNELTGIFIDKLPAIIFDDFTTAFKYVDFPFKAKSSAMKILIPKSKCVNMKFVYEAMQRVRFPLGEHKRYWISEYQRERISYPSKDEQQKIANFLSSVDTKIEQLGKKKALLEQYKKGMMQKLFSQETRFKGEQGNDYPVWEERKLGDVLDYEQPTEYLVENSVYDDGYKTPVLTAGKTFLLGYTNEKTGVFIDKLPTIIFDDFTTAFKYVDFPFKAKSSAMKMLVSKSKCVNMKFVYEAMKRVRFPLGEHKRYWISEYQRERISYPSKEEQQKIADFLSAIDKKIELVAEQLEQARTFKKGLLQQMFI